MGVIFFLAIVVIASIFILGKPKDGIGVNYEDLHIINREKHLCKCYMEKLTEGEQKVADLLATELSYKDYFLFNNIITNSSINISTQIDHIIVSKFGIFVLESKDLNGWIFGSKSQAVWTQSMPRGYKFKFQNPIHQNYGHVMALKELMPFAKDSFYNIVVFTGQAEIKTGSIENVVYLDQLIAHIKKYDKEILSTNQVQYAVGKLSYSCQTINISAPEHVANVQATKNYQTMSNRNQYYQYNQRSFRGNV